jgi:hypothetical protein
LSFTVDRGAADGVTEEVEDEVIHLETGRFGHPMFTEQGPDASQELLKVEGLGQVIVGPGVQAEDFVLN